MKKIFTSRLFLLIASLLLSVYVVNELFELKVTQEIKELSYSDKLILINYGYSGTENEKLLYETWVETPEKIVALETRYENFFDIKILNHTFIINEDDIEKVSCDEKVRIQNEYKEVCRLREEAEQKEKIEEELIENLSKKLCRD